MATIEYKTIIVEPPSGFYLQYKPPDVSGVLNREAQDGWRLVQAIPGSDWLTWLGYAWLSFFLILERERS